MDTSSAASPTDSVHAPAPRRRPDYWMIAACVLFLVSVAFGANQVVLNRKYTESVAAARATPTPTPVPAFSLSFAKTGFGQPVSPYHATLLASPDVIDQQRTRSWQPLDCLVPSVAQSSYTPAQVRASVTDAVLRTGLDDIENFDYTITTTDQAGKTVRETKSKQDITYTRICRDTTAYYVLYLTKEKQQGLRFVPRISAGGGWLGTSNFAVIPVAGPIRIFENVNAKSKTIAVTPITKAGFTKPTDRTFAYYACTGIEGKLGSDLYVVCGGEGGTGLFRVTVSPAVSFTEVSFCWRIMAEDGAYVCYDREGKPYYRAETN